MSFNPSIMHDFISELYVLSPKQLGALSILASYFAIIFVLFAIVGSGLKQSIQQYQTRKNKDFRPFVFGFLAIASFLHTWYYMLRFMEWSFKDYEISNPTNEIGSGLLARVANWLQDTTLFEQAWAIVCSTDSGWWWSQQICLYAVGPWLYFLSIEGNRYQIKHLAAYMLLGQLVAISVASNLFYLAISLSPVNPPPNSAYGTRAPKRLWISVLVGLLTVVISPMTSFDNKSFALNLAVMHICLFVPLVFRKPTNSGEGSIPVVQATTFLAIATLFIRVSHLVKTIPEVFAWQNLETLHSHPAQSSIGYDVVWTGVAYLLWTAMEEGRRFSWFNHLRMAVFDVNLTGIGQMAADLVEARAE